MGKGEIACDKQFLLFQQCLLLNQTIVFHIISLFAAELGEPKIGIRRKGLISTHHVGFQRAITDLE